MYILLCFVKAPVEVGDRKQKSEFIQFSLRLNSNLGTLLEFQEKIVHNMSCIHAWTQTHLLLFMKVWNSHKNFDTLHNVSSLHLLLS